MAATIIDQLVELDELLIDIKRCLRSRAGHHQVTTQPYKPEERDHVVLAVAALVIVDLKVVRVFAAGIEPILVRVVITVIFGRRGEDWSSVLSPPLGSTMLAKSGWRKAAPNAATKSIIARRTARRGKF